jgi:hypothetical protein
MICVSLDGDKGKRIAVRFSFETYPAPKI